MGVIEVDMFPEEVNNLDHPEVVKLHKVLEEVAGEYGCSLLSFDIERGTVYFSFDSDALTARVLKILQENQDDLA